MTEGTWWGSDPDDQPVPLGPSEGPTIADEAEGIVLASQAAIAREDTDPAQSGPLFLAGGQLGARLGWRAKPVDRVALALLALSCLIAFFIGWRHGPPGAGGPHASANDTQGAPVVTGITPPDGGLAFHVMAGLSARPQVRGIEEVRA